MPDDKKKKRTEGYIDKDGNPRDENGNIITVPIQDVDPDQLTFSQMFSSTRRNNPEQKTFMWKGKEYTTKTKQFGGAIGPHGIL